MAKKIFKIMIIIISLLFLSLIIVLVINKNDNKTWVVTQYGDPDAGQSSFYTIKSKKGGLIVIDGGWEYQEEYVREIIKSNGGHIDAWILSHPHQDHIGAFCEIYPNPKDITIDKIYTVDMAPPDVCKEKASWDDMTPYENFLSLDVQDLNYLYEGDSLQFDGLNIDVLSAYGPQVYDVSKDLLNDGALMLKVNSKESSFLFCTDIGKSMSEYLIDKYGDSLKADYMQMGHHGYGGLSDEFYTIVSPQMAFFDAPDWLMFDETGKYDNPENAELMRSLGSEVYSFTTAPNEVVLE